MVRPIASVRRAIAVFGLLAAVFISRAAAADTQILLPLGRTAYQTNEWIDLSVVRKAPHSLVAGELLLTVTGEDGSKVRSTFALRAVPLQGAEARATEHLHLNGRLLRPGHYTVEVAADGAMAKTAVDLFSHVRKTSFRLINRGRAQGKDQLVEGEDSLGFTTSSPSSSEPTFNNVWPSVAPVANPVLPVHPFSPSSYHSLDWYSNGR